MYPWDGKHIFLTGFMATGKSRVGIELARLMGRPFADTDNLIEKRAGMSIPDIFAAEGETGFRKREQDVVVLFSEHPEAVIALGGGAILDPENRRLLDATGITVNLYAQIPVLVDRLLRKTNRPLVHGVSRDELFDYVRDLLDKRKPFYDQAQYQFESTPTESPAELAERIFIHLREDL
jgi:shikimate kinase/3-dehydroquinate synthase